MNRVALITPTYHDKRVALITPTYHDKRVVTSRASTFAIATEIALNLRAEKSLCGIMLYPFDAKLPGSEWIVAATFQVVQR